MPAEAGIVSKRQGLHRVAMNWLPMVVMSHRRLVLFAVMHWRVRHGVNLCHRHGYVSRSVGECANRKETGDENGEQLVHKKSFKSLMWQPPLRKDPHSTNAMRGG